VFLLNRRNFLTFAAAGAAAGSFSNQVNAASTNIKLFTADEAGVLVDSTVIVGERSAVVIDAQFTRSNATALADLIETTGRKVETILITHHHPDHLLGLAVLMDRFPQAKPLAHRSVMAVIEKAAEPTFKALTASAPKGVFPDKLVVPGVLSAPFIELEGERIEVLDPMHGDTEFVTPVHIAALDTLISADVGYIDTHLWLEENTKPEQIDKWRENTKKLEALGAKTIIPGHRNQNSASDASVFAYTRSYLDRWEHALGVAKSADELKALLLNGHEDAGFRFALERSISAAFPK